MFFGVNLSSLYACPQSVGLSVSLPFSMLWRGPPVGLLLPIGLYACCPICQYAKLCFAVLVIFFR